jgi:uncharacterized protein with PIN domain
MAAVTVRFYAELGDLLPADCRGRAFGRELPVGGGSVKDLIEGSGVPHTEVDLVLVDGESVGFDHVLRGGERVAVYPVFEAFDISHTSRVRARPLRQVRFAADVHLGRLAAYLRLAGFDTTYKNDWDDAALVAEALGEHRIVLTRDRGLLMRSAVTHGLLVRETSPRLQLWEVLDRFDLWDALTPFSRCTVCNGPVAAVPKSDVRDVLEAGTARTYDHFWRCRDCGRVYWRGAHCRSLTSLFERGGRRS